MPASTVLPVLAYSDVRKAVEWLCRSFGFTERLQIGDHRAQLSIGDGAIVVAARGADQVTSGRSTHAIMVRILDVDRHFEQARGSGAKIVAPPADYPYGERQYTAEDLEGQLWIFSQTIADVDPASWGGLL
ncbi:MAG: VOC family protein [Byssovorax sp.]